MTDLRVNDAVEFSQYNGIVCKGIILATNIKWEKEGSKAALVKYLWHKDSDPPRRPYKLVDLTKLRKIDIKEIDNPDHKYSKFFDL